MQFGHIDESGKRIIPAPSFYQNDDGTTTFSPSEATHNAHGNYIVANNAPDTSEGYTAVFDGYTLVGNVVRKAYRYEPVVPQPRRWTPLTIKRAAATRGIWGAFKEMLTAKDAYEDFLMCQFVAEDDPSFVELRMALAAKFGEDFVAQFLNGLEVE